MSIKSKKKRDARQKKIKKHSTSTSIVTPMSKKKYLTNFDRIFDPQKMTTPRQVTEDINKFCKKISSTLPFYTQVLPEDWSRQSCCDLNVKRYIELHGGEIICGYKIWYHEPILIEAERHAIWHHNGQYKDITFNSDGEDNILFVPDILEKQHSLSANKEKIRWGKDTKTKRVIMVLEELEKNVPIQQMSDEQSWNTMLKYEDWKKGDRMPSIFPVSY